MDATRHALMDALDRVETQRDALAQIINHLASIPAPAFYRPGDWAAEEVAKAWREKNRVLETPRS